MLVKELIEKLLQMNPNARIILQSDSEGNSCSPLEGLCSGTYHPNSSWSGEFNGSRGKSAILLWPIN